MTARDAQREALPPRQSQEQEHGDLAAPCRDVPSAASRGEAAGAGHRAPTQPEPPLNDRAQAIEQCRAVAHMARALANVHEARALILQRMDDPPIEIIGESSAQIMEWLGDALSNMDAVEAEDSWIDPVFERAHVRWPLQSQGREVPTGRDRTSEAGRSPASYGARRDDPDTSELLRQAAEALENAHAFLDDDLADASYLMASRECARLAAALRQRLGERA